MGGHMPKSTKWVEERLGKLVKLSLAKGVAGVTLNRLANFNGGLVNFSDGEADSYKGGIGEPRLCDTAGKL